MTWSNTIERTTFKIGANELPDIQVNGAPAVASTSMGRLDVFVRGIDNHLYHNVLVNDAWPDNWEDITPKDKSITTSPAAVAWGPNRVDVFAVWESLEYENFHYLQQKYVHHNYRELKQGDKGWGWYWSGWTPEYFEGGETQHAPAVVTFKPDSFDRQEVFIRQENDHLKRKTWLSGVEATKLGKEEGWGGSGFWDDLDTDGGLNSAPAAVASAPGTIALFGVNANGQLEHRREVNGVINAWQPISYKPGIINNINIGKPPTDFYNQYDAPAAASAITAGWRVDVFVRDNNGHLKKSYFNMNTSQMEENWVDTEGIISSAPAAVAWYEGDKPKRFDVFAATEEWDRLIGVMNHKLFHSCWKAG